MAEVKLEVSSPTFNEIAGLLEAKGIDIGKDGTVLTLTKGTSLVRPIDYRLVTIRRDCVIEASKIWRDGASNSFIEFSNKIYEYVLNSKMPTDDVKVVPVVSGWDLGKKE